MIKKIVGVPTPEQQATWDAEDAAEQAKFLENLKNFLENLKNIVDPDGDPLNETISIEGFTPAVPEQEICSWCERLNCATLQHMRTLDDKAAFDYSMVLCVGVATEQPIAWYDPKLLPRDGVASKCGRCWKWQPFAPVCLRCVRALESYYEQKEKENTP